MTRRSGYRALTLGRHQLAAEPGAAVLVATTVLLVSFVLGAWPRAVDSLLGDDLRTQVSAVPAVQRDPATSAHWVPGTAGTARAADPADPSDATAALAGWIEELEATAAGAGPHLRAVLGEPRATMTRLRDPIERGPRAPDVHDMTLAVRLDATIGARIRLVEGQAPAPFDSAAVLASGTALARALAENPIDVVLSVETADRMRWEVGEERRMLGVVPFRIHLSGIYEAVDLEDGTWSHGPSTLTPAVLVDGDIGTSVHGTGYADPSAGGALASVGGLQADRWLTVEPAALVGTDADPLLRELRALLDANGLGTELDDHLGAIAARHATFTGLLDTIALGPVGVALAVLWLASVLATERRRTALALASARGGSAAGLRTAIAVQGLVVGLPAAALGATTAALALPRTGGSAAWILPGLVGLAPAVLMALAAGPALRAGVERRDLGARPAGRRRLRLGLEVLVGALAALSAVAVAGRAPGGAPDPIQLAAPVLLALVGGLATLRLIPVPMRAAARALHGRRGLAHFLGAARATRSVGAGLPALVALVLGVAISVLSGIAGATVTGGIQRTAATAVGADVRVDVRREGTVLPADGVAAASALTGVTEAVPVADLGQGSLRVAHSSVSVAVLVVDGAALARVQSGLPGLERLPDVGGGDGEMLRVVVGGPTGGALPQAASLHIGERDIDLDVVAVRRSVPGVTTGSSWVLVDEAAWTALTGTTPAATRLLLDASGSDLPAVADAAREVMTGAPDGTAPAPLLGVTSTATVRAGIEDGALVRGTRVGLLAATALSGLLSLLVVVLALALRTPERGRLAALLATVGAPRGTAWRLVAWEVWPLVATSAAVGAAIGVGLPYLVLGAFDLRAFTGGQPDPPVVVDPAVLAGVGVSALVTTVVSIVLAASHARATSTAAVLREGDRP